MSSMAATAQLPTCTSYLPCLLWPWRVARTILLRQKDSGSGLLARAGHASSDVFRLLKTSGRDSREDSFGTSYYLLPVPDQAKVNT